MSIVSQVSVPWSKSGEEVVALTQSDSVSGLTEGAVLPHQHQYGKNEVRETDRFRLLRILWRQCSSPLIFILVVAAVVTALLDERVDSLIISLAIFINVALGFYQELRAEQAVAKLRTFITVRTRVIRDGREREIDATEVVVGDLVHISYGSRIPADGRLLQLQGLMVDEAILTGESLPVEKKLELCPDDAPVSERINMVFGGTMVSEGSGLMIVTAVGSQTELGIIAELVGGTKRELTPLQKTVATMAWFITIGISIFVMGVFLLGISRGESVLEMFVVSVAVAVGAIPEALPIGLTAVLAVGVERLSKRKGVMRSLAAAETLGSTTLVMTDKTGTLTTASLSLVSVLGVPELRSSVLVTGEDKKLSAEQKNILRLAVLGTDVVVENPQDEPSSWRVIGNVLEATIYKGAALQGIDVTESERFPLQIPFSSSHKFSASRGVTTATGGESMTNESLIVVGAPDILLGRSTLLMADRAAIIARLEAESLAGRRLVGVATRILSPSDSVDTVDQVRDLDFVGVIAFYDPVRVEVPAAIKTIEEYGVRVVIATGDLPGTAVSVATALGWLVAPSEVVTGDMLQKMTDDELREKLKTVKIFARVTPSDKLRVAKLFQASGQVVAMTGDGVNDAPSLKAVDIGIAVGSGSDVAKGVADLILLDDNFNTIVAAIEEGKRVLGNIRKTFVYLMSNSLDEIFLIGGSLLFGLALPLSAMQIIWVNFFTGSLPAIAFAFDKTVSHRTKRAPEHIISRHVLRLTVIIGVMISLLLFAMYYVLANTALPQDMVRTFIFVCFATYILIISYSFRHLHKPIWQYRPFDNQVLNVGVIIGLVLTIATLYIPFFQDVFETTALPLMWWGGVLIWLLFTILFVELSKWVSHRLQ